MHANKLINLALLILVNTMWAAQYAAYKTATSQMGAVTISAWTFLLASLVLLPFLFMERRGRALTDAPNPSERRWTWRDITGFAIIGVFGLIPASAFLAWGTQRSTASNAALIYLTIPILTALLASVILGERMTWSKWISLGISLAGVLLLSQSELREQNLVDRDYFTGNLLVLIACASSSFYNVYCKDLLNRFSALEVLVYGYVMATILSIPLVWWTEPQAFSTIASYRPATWLSILALSIVSWGLAMVLWMFVLRRLDVSQASVSIYLLPFLGVVISAITLDEPLTGSMLIGGLVTLAGAVMITVFESPTAESSA